MRAIAVFTHRGLNGLLADGGSRAWKLDPVRVRKLRYVLCVQNREDGDRGEPSHAQGQAFLLGRISGVEPDNEVGGRFIIRFDEYADIDLPNFWEGWRNPVKYIDLGECGINPDTLTFKPVEHLQRRPPSTATSNEVQAMDMAHAKKALSAFYSVPASSIEITIRG